MATFLMLGKYTPESVKAISAGRTEKARKLVEDLGGKVVGLYALLGEHDLAILLELPDLDRAVRASIELQRATGIGFTTSPAIPADRFDTLMAGG